MLKLSDRYIRAYVFKSLLFYLLLCIVDNFHNRNLQNKREWKNGVDWKLPV